MALNQLCIKQENSRIKLSLKTEKLAVSNPSDQKSVFSEENKKEMREEDRWREQRTRGYLVFATLQYRVEYREWRVRISLMSVLFSSSGRTKS